MLILLPPSEGKEPGGTDLWNPNSGRFGAQLQEPRDVVNALLNDESVPLPAGARRTVPVSLPAFQRYNGVVWKHLDPASFTDKMLVRALASVVVVSAIGGLFAYDDPVPEYKLKVGASLRGIGAVSKMWLPFLGKAIELELQKDCHDGQRYVIDLLALDQSAAMKRPAGLPWYRVELFGPKGERSGHNGKAAKGRLARSLLESDEPEKDLDDILKGCFFEDLDGWIPRLSS